MLGTNALSELPLGSLSGPSELALSRAPVAAVSSSASAVGALAVSHSVVAHSSVSASASLSTATLSRGTATVGCVAHGRAHTELDTGRTAQAHVGTLASAIVRLDCGTRIVRVKTSVLTDATAQSAVMPVKTCVLSPVIEDRHAISHPLPLVVGVCSAVLENATVTVEVVNE